MVNSSSSSSATQSGQFQPVSSSSSQVLESSGQDISSESSSIEVVAEP